MEKAMRRTDAVVMPYKNPLRTPDQDSGAATGPVPENVPHGWQGTAGAAQPGSVPGPHPPVESQGWEGSARQLHAADQRLAERGSVLMTASGLDRAREQKGSGGTGRAVLTEERKDRKGREQGCGGLRAVQPQGTEQ